jgi:hypothetical protein
VVDEFTATISIVHNATTPASPLEIEISGTSVDNSILWSAFYENFNATAFPPPHWTRGNTPPLNLTPINQPFGTSQWSRETFANTAGHTFGHAAYFNNYMVRNEWLITPQIILDAGFYSVEFDAMAKMWSGHTAPTNPGEDKRLIVLAKRVSDPWELGHIIAEWNGDGTGNSLNPDLDVLEGSYTSLFSPLDLPTLEENRKSILIPPALSEGGIQLAFIGCSTLNTPDTRLYVDNVTVVQHQGGPDFAIPPDLQTISFGTVQVGNPVSRSFTIRNMGGQNGLEISNVSITNTENYSVTGFTDTVSLNVGERLIVTVVLNPDSNPALGNRPENAVLTITYDDEGGPENHTVDLTSAVIDPRILTFPHIENFTGPIVAGHQVFDFWSRHQTQFNENGQTTLAAPQAQTAAWTQNASNWGVWNFMNQAGHELGTAAAINIASSGVPSRCNWLVSPQIVIPADQGLHLNFKFARSSFSGNNTPGTATATQKFLVIVSTDGGATWQNDNVVARWDGNPVNHGLDFSMNMNLIQNFPGSTTDFYDIDLDLSHFTGSIKIAFYGESQTGGDFNFYVDDFHLTTAPLGDASAFNITPAATNITIPTTLVSESFTRTFTVRNSGGGDGLVITSIALTGDEEFTLDISNLTTPLDAGGSFRFDVTYTPEAEDDDPHTATLTIAYTDDDGAGTHVVSLTASSVDHRIILTPTNTYEQNFEVAPDTSPTAGHHLFDRWNRYRLPFSETAPNILPAPILPTVGWWGATTVWGVRHFSNNPTHELGRAVHVNIYGSSISEWLVTPTIIVPEFHDLTIEFKFARSAWSGNSAPPTATATQKFMVMISTDNGLTWENANVVARWDGNPENHTAGISRNMNEFLNFTSNDEFYEFSETFTGYTGAIKIAFYGESLAGGGDFNFYIDDLALSVSELEYIPPVNVAATPDGSGVLKITWDLPPFSDNPTTTRNLTDLHGFNIYRDGSAEPIVQIPYTDGMQLEWRNTGLVNGRQYTYRMRATYDNGDEASGLSNIAIGIPSSGIPEDTWAPPVFQSIVSGYDVKLYWLSPRLAPTLLANDSLLMPSESGRLILNTSALEDIDLPLSRALVSYQIYRDGVLIHTMNDVAAQMEFNWTDTPGNTNNVYTYRIRALYDYAPSPYNEIEASIYTVASYPWNADLSDTIKNIRYLIQKGGTDATKNVVEEFPKGWTRFATELDGEVNPIADMSAIWYLDDYPNSTDDALSLILSDHEAAAFADWAVSPTLNFSAGFEYALSFDIALDADETTLPDDVRLAVVLSTDNGVTWSESNVKKSWVGDEILAIPVAGTSVGVSLGVLTGLHKFGFYFEQAEGDYDLDLWIRNIRIERNVSESDRELALSRTGLNANYPNPFNPSTTISFNLSNDNALSPVTVDIYNIRGQHVRSLVHGILTPGEHSVVWNGTDDNGREAGSGIYFYRMRAGDFSETRKMILMK